MKLARRRGIIERERLGRRNDFGIRRSTVLEPTSCLHTVASSSQVSAWKSEPSRHPDSIHPG
jgi:hypothetical protein